MRIHEDVVTLVQVNDGDAAGVKRFDEFFEGGEKVVTGLFVAAERVPGDVSPNSRMWPRPAIDHGIAKLLGNPGLAGHATVDSHFAVVETLAQPTQRDAECRLLPAELAHGPLLGIIRPGVKRGGGEGVVFEDFQATPGIAAGLERLGWIIMAQRPQPPGPRSNRSRSGGIGGGGSYFGTKPIGHRGIVRPRGLGVGGGVIQ